MVQIGIIKSKNMLVIVTRLPFCTWGQRENYAVIQIGKYWKTKMEWSSEKGCGEREKKKKQCKQNINLINNKLRNTSKDKIARKEDWVFHKAGCTHGPRKNGTSCLSTSKPGCLGAEAPFISSITSPSQHEISLPKDLPWWVHTWRGEFIFSLRGCALKCSQECAGYSLPTGELGSLEHD